MLIGSKLELSPLTRIWAKYFDPLLNNEIAYLGFKLKCFEIPIKKKF